MNLSRNNHVVDERERNKTFPEETMQNYLAIYKVLLKCSSSGNTNGKLELLTDIKCENENVSEKD